MGKGLFFNNEIEMLININSEYELKERVFTLIHETAHLYLKKNIFEACCIKRMVWFDEVYATIVDGYAEEMVNEYELRQVLSALNKFSNFDVNELDDIKNIKTKDYDGYDMFIVIAKYIIENNLTKEYLETIKENPEKIREVGKTILSKSLKYLATKLNNKQYK